MDLQLTDEQTAALLTELDRIIDHDRYPLSPRILRLKEIRALIKPYPTVPEPAPPPKVYERHRRADIGGAVQALPRPADDAWQCQRSAGRALHSILCGKQDASLRHKAGF
jgi:hypothetical protein